MLRTPAKYDLSWEIGLSGKLKHQLSGFELGEGKHCGFSFTGTHNRSMAFVDGMARIKRLAGRRPSGAVTVKNQIMFDREFQPRLGKALLYG